VRQTTRTIAVSNFIQTRLGHRAYLITGSTFSYGGGKIATIHGSPGRDYRG
jgi:hypothetical protein